MRKRNVGWLALAALALLGAPVIAQDNLDGGWAAPFGGLYGTARAPFPVIFPPGGETEVAWMLDPNEPNGINFRPPANATQIVFDSAGNLYWHSIDFWWNDYVASCTPDGQMRWVGPTGGLGFLQTDLTPVVGQDRVYMLGMFDPNEYYIDPNDWCNFTAQRVFALNKLDGSEAWRVKLDNEAYCPEPQSNNSQPTPMLYDGRLFVMGIPMLDRGVALYQIDAATGTILGNNVIPEIKDRMLANSCLVPNKFGPGVHGLYVMMYDTEYWPPDPPVLFGVAVDTTTNTAAVQWNSDPNFSGNEIGFTDWGTWSHVMYNATTDRIYAYSEENSAGFTWFSFDPVIGDDWAGWGLAGGWWLCSGRYQTGALDFDDTRMVHGAMDGGFSIYEDDGAGNVDWVESLHHLTWDQPRQFVQLVQDPNGHTCAVTGTSGIGSGMTHIMMCDLDDRADPAEDGPLYIDEIEVYEGPDVDHLLLVYSEDFEAYSEGELPPASGWVSLYGHEQPAPQVVSDPTGEGHGMVLALDPVAPPDPDDPNNTWGHGVYHAFAQTTGSVVVTKYKQWMQDTTEIYEIMWGANETDYTRGFAYGEVWYSRRCTLEWLEAWNQPNYQIDRRWEDVMYTYDFPATTASVKMADRDQVDTVWDPGESYAPTNSAAGIGFTMWHGDISDNWPRLRVNYLLDARWGWQDLNALGGPMVGPDGKIYFFETHQSGWTPPNEHRGWLYALQPKVLCVGDIDGDDDTDLSDLAALLGSYNKSPGDPGWEPNADFDGDGDVDLGDLAHLLGDYGCGK